MGVSCKGEMSMKRLTKRNIHGVPYYPECFDKCAGKGPSIKCHCCYFEHEIIIKLAGYEDLEEQGRLIKLPCKVGDKVYSVECNEIKEFIVSDFDVCMKGIYAYQGYTFIGQMGFSVFATKEKAEKALAEMGE